MTYSEQELDIIKNLIKAIKNNTKFNDDVRNTLINYVTNIREGKCNNDFYEIDFLNSAILNIINSNGDVEQKIDNFKNLQIKVKELLPLGLETPDYEIIKNMILTGNSLIEQKLYSLLDSKVDYINLLNIIKSNDLYLENYNNIIDYATSVSPYCINQGELKSEIISFINGLNSELDDITTYKIQKLDEARKKCGIYDVDEKTLSLIHNEVKKASSLIKQLEIMKKQVKTYAEEIETLVKHSTNEIDNHGQNAVEKLNQDIEKLRIEIVKGLTEYQETLEISLKNSKEEVFNQILSDAKEELAQMKRLVINMSKDNTKELLKVQKATDDAIEKINNYLTNEPELRELLNQSVNYEEIKEAIDKYEQIKEESKEQVQTVSTPIIHIPGIDRDITPASSNVSVPTSIDSKILPAFDERIPFDKRMDAIMKRKEKREKNGELFHSMTDEVINCIMEGDWPYLYGPSGCGKSHLIKQAASLIGIDLVENGKITDKYSIMAYNDPHGRFRATQAFVALVYGRLLSLDEFDNGNPDTQVVLNELYSGLLDTMSNPNEKRFITFAEDMVLPINHNFRMISAGNTSGEGENQIFSSRGKIDESVLERMTPKKFDYDNEVEKRLFGEYTNWYNLFVNFRTACDKYAVQNGLTSAPGMITTRDAAFIVKYIKHNSKSVDQIMMEKFIQTKNNDYLNTVIDTIVKKYSISRNSENPSISSSEKLSSLDEKVLALKLVHNANKVLKSKNN